MRLLSYPLLAVSLVAGWLAAPAAAAPVVLLTASEAARPDRPSPKGLPPVAANLPGPKGDKPLEKMDTGMTPLSGAPQIFVDLPEPGLEVAAPFPVKIRFVPAAGAKIKVDSVKIDVLKLVPISLLSRVKPYLSPAGINVPEAKIPTGTYNVRIAVADDLGREGMTVQVWTVR